MGPKQVQEVKTLDIERFDGTNGTCKDFLLHVNVNFDINPSTYTTDKAKCLYLITHLKGPAFRWVSTYLETNDPILENYEEFTQKLLSVFHQPDDTEGLMDQLTELRQGNGTVLEYACKFKQLSSLVGWNEAPLIYFFRKGLSPKIREILGSQEPSASLEDAMTKAIRIGNSIKPHPQVTTTHHVKPRQVHTTPAQGPAGSLEELTSRFEQLDPRQQRYLYRGVYNLCHICGAAEHRSNECPKRRGPPPASLKAPGQTQQ
jgi:hypothetical protein